MKKKDHHIGKDDMITPTPRHSAFYVPLLHSIMCSNPPEFQSIFYSLIYLQDSYAPLLLSESSTQSSLGADEI